MIKAIETVYNGYRFRSRLEARWAVFFDALGVKYRYEPEGFELDGVGRYLPDFWLETVNMWAEVKPKEFTTEEKARCKALSLASGHACLMLDGEPEVRDYSGFDIQPEYDDEGYEKTDGCLEVVERTWILDDQYTEDEHRFFCDAGISVGDEWRLSERAKAAYLAARQARFEHGESGAPKQVSSYDIERLQYVYKALRGHESMMRSSYAYARRQFENIAWKYGQDGDPLLCTRAVEALDKAREAWGNEFDPIYDAIQALMRRAGLDENKTFFAKDPDWMQP